MLRSHIDANRIVPTPEEKAKLIRWGASFGHKIDGVIEVVKPATYRKWLRMKKRRIPFKKSARPPIADYIRKLVIKMAKENPLWGYLHIMGELKKTICRIGKIKREYLGHFICFNLSQLQYINHTWFRYYNTERLHQGFGIEKRVLDEYFEPQTTGLVKCKKELGGIIKSYYREAA